MSYAEFSIVLFQNFYYFLLGFFLIFIILFLIYKKYFFNIFDPLILLFINLSSCLVVILYLLLFKQQSNKSELMVLLLINLIFLITLKFKLLKKNIFFGKKLNKKRFRIYYCIHTIFFLLVVVFFIKEVGLKLIQSKLTAFSNIGWLNYMRTFFIPSQLVLLIIKRELYKIKHKKDYIVFLIVFFLYVISGSKVGIVNMIILIFISLGHINKMQKNRIYLNLKKNIKKILIVAVIGILLGFKLTGGTENILKRIIFRIISAGDIYYMLYVNNNINKVQNLDLINYYFLLVFKPILKYFIDIKENLSLGRQAVEIVYGIQTNEFGPNTRYDTIWQLNCGYFGIVGGYLSASLIAFFRRIKTKNFYILNLLLLILVSIESILTDYTLFGVVIFSIILCFIPLILLTEVILKVLK